MPALLMSTKNRHINLLPKEDFERTTLGRIMKWALSSFRFIVIVVEFVVIVGFLFRFWLDVQINNLDDEINQKSALVSSKAPFEAEYRRTQTKLSMFSALSSKDNLALPVMEQVYANLPADTQLMELTRTGDVLLISGATLNEASITIFMSALESSGVFTSTELERIATTKDSPLIEFTLRVTLLRQTADLQ